MTTRLDDTGLTFSDASLQAKASYPATFLAATLGSDVAMPNATLYYDGPSLTLGSTGTWLVIARLVLLDTGAPTGFNLKLWDGTTVFDSGFFTTAAANFSLACTCFAVVSNPAGGIVKISARETTSTSGVIKSSSSGNAKDSSITAVRIG